MNNITKAVKMKYGKKDEPMPVFGCPVVIDPKALGVLKRVGYRIDQVLNDAAKAVDLVSRFEQASRYVDFAPELALTEGTLPVAMRVEMVKGRTESVARIDLVPSVRGLH